MDQERPLKLLCRRREALWVSAMQAVVGVFLIVSGAACKVLFASNYNWTAIYDGFGDMCFIWSSIALVTALIGFAAHTYQSTKLACVFCVVLALQWTLLFIAFILTIFGIVWQWVYEYFCWECPECNPVPDIDTCKLAFKMWISGFEGAVVLVVTGFCVIVVAAFRELREDPAVDPLSENSNGNASPTKYGNEASSL